MFDFIDGTPNNESDILVEKHLHIHHEPNVTVTGTEAPTSSWMLLVINVEQSKNFVASTFIKIILVCSHVNVFFFGVTKEAYRQEYMTNTSNEEYEGKICLVCLLVGVGEVMLEVLKRYMFPNSLF